MADSAFSRSGLARLGTLAIAAALLGVAAASAANGPSSDPTEVKPTAGPEGAVVDRRIPSSQSPSHLPTTSAPRPAPLAVAGPGSELGMHFAGLTFHNQRRDADGGNQLSADPPDQGLCVGNGEVIEPVNDLLTTYDAASGSRTGGYESLSQFFFGRHEIDRTQSPPVYGPFVTDPRCAYDPGTNRFFLTLLAIGRDPSTGALQPPATIQIATSTSGTPSVETSDWTFTSIDVTNDGRNGEQSHPGCPCFGDQPLLGVDANGVYLTTNEFPITGPGFNGAQIYAVQKSALVRGRPPAVQRIEGAPISTGYGEGIPYSLQPATSPSAGDYAAAGNGTEYLLGALEFGKEPVALDNRIAVWALTNTASLNGKTPAVAVSTKVIPSEVYGFPPAIVQPNGPTPVADSFKAHENLVDGGDDRMQAAVYAHGHLWGASDTIVKTPTGSSQVGTAYYMVSPSVDASGAVSGTVDKQGYVSVNGDSVTRPSLGVTSSGKVVLGLSLVGPDYFPSAAYTMFDDSVSSAPSALHVAAAGPAPADGFSGFAAFNGNGVERWGDYGFAAADGDGVWVANEWIPGLAQPGDIANWGTFLSRVTP
jgi:hypothetical protein